MSSTHGIGIKRCSMKSSERTRQRREVARVEAESARLFYGESDVANAPTATPSRIRADPRPKGVLALVVHAREFARTMPRGVCRGCREEGPLPPFGEGLCFLCATDGPPGEHTATGGALGEDEDARREEAADWHEAGDLTDQIREEFTEARAGSSSTVRWTNLGAEVLNEFAEVASRYEEASGLDFLRASFAANEHARFSVDPASLQETRQQAAKLAAAATVGVKVARLTRSTRPGSFACRLAAWRVVVAPSPSSLPLSDIRVRAAIWAAKVRA